ncbi:MAG: ATP-binding protein [Pirellulales bacterium]
MPAITYSFYTRLAEILNSGQSRSVLVCGNVYDLYFDGKEYMPLISFLAEKMQTDSVIRIVYEQNGPLRVLDHPDKLKNCWIAWKSGLDPDTLLLKGLQGKGPSEFDRLSAEYDGLLRDAIGNPTLALEVLRQLTICSRTHLSLDLLILIEAADMMIAAGNGDVASLNDKQLHRISIVQDWFNDPQFMNGGDAVVLIAESRSLIHPRVARLPQVMSVEAMSPDTEQRLAYIGHYTEKAQVAPKFWSTPEDLAAFSAGLSIHAIKQLLTQASYTRQPLQPDDLVDKVQEFIQAQLGEDVVEFKKPSHTLKDVIGFTKLKNFLRDELLPRFRGPRDKAISGAAVAGPIGGGKTFIFEAFATELDMPVLVLKSIRSQWYGQTDVIFERLRRVLQALERVVIFVDEADTQFGGVDSNTHETERRLTGKIQAMMSDPVLRGRVFWLLMTARIHLLSPDIRRPGRVGDLIIPVLDPEGDDRKEFTTWVLKAVIPAPTDEQIQKMLELTEGYSAAAYSSLRSNLKARESKTMEEVESVVYDLLPPDIGDARRYQTLQALLNCTRRSLLPDPQITESDRTKWQAELRELELRGVG